PAVVDASESMRRSSTWGREHNAKEVGQRSDKNVEGHDEYFMLPFIEQDYVPVETAQPVTGMPGFASTKAITNAFTGTLPPGAGQATDGASNTVFWSRDGSRINATKSDKGAGWSYDRAGAPGGGSLGMMGGGPGMMGGGPGMMGGGGFGGGGLGG